jgi:coenzyme F420-reducing hydrogenase gamma subunit
MKHGKWHKRQVEQSLPAWKDEFLRYKELKPIISAVTGCPPSPDEFVALLDAEIEKINTFFIEQEEVFIIRHKVCNLISANPKGFACTINFSDDVRFLGRVRAGAAGGDREGASEEAGGA